MSQQTRIIFAGSGAFGLPTLKAMVSAGMTPVLVVTQPDKPAGRGKKLTPTPIGSYAESAGLSLIKTDSLNSLDLPPADVMAVIAFGQKIAPHAVNHPTCGSINLHASLLPRHRGAAPIHWAVMSGDAVTGNSVIRLAEKMDAGAVLGTNQLTIEDQHTTGDLHDVLAEMGAPLMLSIIEQLTRGTASEVEQDHSQATLAPKLSRKDAVVDFTQSERVVSRRINGLSPWPGCRVEVSDGTSTDRLTLLRSVPVEKRVSEGVIEVDAVGCSAGSVRILEVLPEGRRPMPLTDYARGKPWRDGMRVRGIT